MRLVFSIIFFLFPTLHAFSESIPFAGEVQATCSITLEAPGRLAVSKEKWLTSTAPGGESGRVLVVTSGDGFSLSTTAPSAFSAAPALDGPLDFRSTYRVTGATSVGVMDGNTPSRLNRGANTVAIDLFVFAASPVGSFPAGTYEAEVTVTCE